MGFRARNACRSEGRFIVEMEERSLIKRKIERKRRIKELGVEEENVRPKLILTITPHLRYNQGLDLT